MPVLVAELHGAGLGVWLQAAFKPFLHLALAWLLKENGELALEEEEEMLANHLTALEQSFYDALARRVLPGLLQECSKNKGNVWLRSAGQADGRQAVTGSFWGSF